MKRIYGVLESQFRTYFEEADRRKGITGENLLVMLASRDTAAILGILDPCYPPPVPLLVDPAPFVRMMASLLRDRFGAGAG